MPVTDFHLSRTFDEATRFDAALPAMKQTRRDDAVIRPEEGHST